MIAVDVTLILDVDELELHDGVNEILREIQRSYIETSCLLDYYINNKYKIVPLDSVSYQVGDAEQYIRKIVP